MRDHDDGFAVLAVERLEQIQNFIARLAIQVARRLVAQQESRIGDDGAGDADPLLFAAGKGARIMLGAMGQANHRQGGLDMLGALGFGKVGEQQGQFHIPFRVQDRHQVVKLKNKAHMPRAPLRQLTVGKMVNALAAHRHGTLRGPVQTADQIKQGAFARSRRPHQGEKLAGRNLQIQVGQHMDVFRRRDGKSSPRLPRRTSAPSLVVLSLMAFL